MNMSIYDRMTDNARDKQGHASIKVFGIELSRDGHAKATLSESIRLAKAHLKIWLREGLFADSYHLQRARELFEANLRKQINPVSNISKSAASISRMISSTNFAESSPKKEEMGFITNSKILPDDWLAYFRVLSLCGDYAAAVVSYTLTSSHSHSLVCRNEYLPLPWCYASTIGGGQSNANFV